MLGPLSHTTHSLGSPALSGAPGVPGCLPSDISGCPIGILCSVCTHLNPAYSPSSQFFRLTPPSFPKPRDLALWKLPAAPPAGSTLLLSPSCSVAQETDLYTPHLLPLLTYSFWLSSANGRHQQESKVGVFTLLPLSLLVWTGGACSLLHYCCSLNSSDPRFTSSSPEHTCSLYCCPQVLHMPSFVFPNPTHPLISLSLNSSWLR